MKNKIITTIIATLFLATTVMAREEPCLNLNKELMMELLILTKSKQYDIVNTILNKYCYSDEEFKQSGIIPPYFYAKDVETMKLYKQINHSLFKSTNKIGQDLLTQKLSYPIVENSLGDEKNVERQKRIDNALNKYHVDTSAFLIQSTTDEATSILSFLTSEYINESIDNRDTLGLNALVYAIYINEINVLSKLLSSKKYIDDLTIKDNTNFTAMHYAFAKKEYPNNSSIAISKTNDLLMAVLESKHITLLNNSELSFFNFIELMKDNNSDLYFKFKTKFPFEVKINSQSSSTINLINDFNNQINLKQRLIETHKN